MAFNTQTSSAPLLPYQGHNKLSAPQIIPGIFIKVSILLWIGIQSWESLIKAGYVHLTL